MSDEIKRLIRLELDQTQSKVVRTDRGGESGRHERNRNTDIGVKKESDSESI